MKKIILIIIVLVCFSCKEKQTDFVESKVIDKLILVKNPSELDYLLKKQLVTFLVNNPTRLKEGCFIEFYKYTSETKYFLENKEDFSGGFSGKELSNYQNEYGIARFRIKRCIKDTTKLVGELRYYNDKYGNFYKPDTIIYKCK